MISITGLSLAFCAFVLLPVARRSLRETPFECPDETRRVPISNGVGNFLHAHIAVRKQVRCSTKSLFVQPFTHGNTSLVFEQTLEIARAQVEFDGQITDGKSPRLNHFHDFLHAAIQHCGRPWGGIRGMQFASTKSGGVFSVPYCKTDARIQSSHGALLKGSPVGCKSLDRREPLPGRDKPKRWIGQLDCGGAKWRPRMF